MISEVLSAMKGAAFFPIVALVVFIAAFVGIVIWVVRMRKLDVQRYSRLPLEESVDEGDSTHG